jgi:hypothetical protein
MYGKFASSRHVRTWGAAAFGLAAAGVLAGALYAPSPAQPTEVVPLEITDIHFEYNSSANDLGVHVNLDGEDWKSLTITDPHGKTIFGVMGKGPYQELGLTELFFEGAEPSLDEFPLDELLARFPEGDYGFSGKTVDNQPITGTGNLTHAIPAGPSVSVEMGPNDLLRIHWTAVTGTPPGFPALPIHIKGYQVLVDPFQVTVPANVLSVTISPEFVHSLAPGEHPFEVLAIEDGDNQTITEGTFVK